MSCLKNRSKSSKCPTALPSCAYHFSDTLLIWTSLSKGRVATPYIAMRMCSLWVVPSRDCTVLPASYKSDGVENEFWRTKLKLGQILLIFSTAKLPWRELMALLRLLREQLHFQVFHIASADSELGAQSRIFGQAQNCVVPPRNRRSFVIRTLDVAFA